MPAETIRVRGQVQGVGFRPFVWHLAAEHGVLGQVSNDGDGVLIHAEAGSLDRFAAALVAEAPPLARVDAIERAPAIPKAGLASFEIIQTTASAARTRVTPDAALCAACRAEISDPAERRFRYAFANCTHCGPRFSIVERVPYDRASTTMRHFPICTACRAEYEDPADRRFHAQPIACPDCGPRLWLDVDGAEQPGDPIVMAAERLKAGAILGIKALGGFHIACDATNEGAVARLRERKRRPGKPFALMAPDLATIAAYAPVSEEEADLLTSAAAPVVLLQRNAAPRDRATGTKACVRPKGARNVRPPREAARAYAGALHRRDTDQAEERQTESANMLLAPSVAPGQWTLGCMLPATPLHVLLMQAVGRPLIMTSGNVSGEPQAIGNDEARERLDPYVDAFLMHNRKIARRLDDPVAMHASGRTRVLRRARGYAPSTLPLPRGFEDAPPVAAFGALLKSAICLTGDGRALLSHHLGDLDDPLTADEFAKAERDYAAVFDHAPAVLACDLHPDYRSTAHAEARAAALGVPLERVQHHHAHIAAAMAENGWGLTDGPVIGVALDGLGLGPDGTVWGGEILLADYRAYRRLACLAPVPLPGGEAAQREPWRNLLAQLDAAGLEAEADRLLAGKPLPTLRAAIRQSLNAPLSSSAGRLFDAVAAALGIAPDVQSYEGEAAMLLEAAARCGAEGGAYPFTVSEDRIDPAPMWKALLRNLDCGVAPGTIAARFHGGLAKALCGTALAFARAHDAGAIALSGGVFQNRTLLELCLDCLGKTSVLTHAETPPNDGGLALGQAVIAAARGMP